MQRTLRDLITDTVDEMSRTLADALRAAQRAAKVATAEREARMRELAPAAGPRSTGCAAGGRPG